MGFWDFYRTIRKRRWMILGLVAATVLSIMISTAHREKVYQASASILPSAEALSKPILSAPQPGTEGGGAQEYGAQMPNLISLITSRAVAEQVVQILGLDMSPDRLRKQLKVTSASDSGDQRGRGLQADILQIIATDRDPDAAVNIANATASVFATYYQEITHKAAVENSEFLQGELENARQNLDDAQARLRRFRESRKITSLPEESAAAASAKREMQSQREQAAAQLAEVQASLARVTSQLKSVPKSRSEVSGTTDSPKVQELEKRVAALRISLSDARSKYTDSHPTVQQLLDDLSAANRQLDEERTKLRTVTTMSPNPVYQELQAQLVRLQSQRDGLAARVAQLSASIGRVGNGPAPGDEVELNRLTQEYNDSQAAYTELKTRLAAARFSEKDTTHTGAIRLVDRAYSAEGPIGKNRGMLLTLGIVFSLILGVGLAVGLEYLDNSIKSQHDAEQLLSLPVTALIPSVGGRVAPALPRITYVDPLSPLAEAYRFLRTDLLLTAAETGARAIMVATAKPGQGGTTTAANLAIALAMDGRRVILVDADLRRPCLHEIFKAGNDTGLSDVLMGLKDLKDVILSTEISNLLLIPGGQPPLNPSELVGSRKMREIVQQLKDQADFVIFDTPAAIAFTDTVVLSQWLDGAVLVLRANQVPRGAELQVRQIFNKANVRILSVVLNDVEPNDVDSYYYHSHYYPGGSKKTQRALTGRVEHEKLPEPEKNVEEDDIEPASRI